MGAIAGADGCRGGWLTIERGGDSLSIHVHRSTSDLMNRAGHLDVLTIDIPIGLPDSGPRQADVIARRLLGPPRASSVFPAPVRAALTASTYEEACALSFEACGKRLSRQAYAILPKIRDVDSALREDQRLQSHVREVHPEICFYFINDKRPLEHPKKSGQGFLRRHALVEAHFGPVFDSLRASVARSVAEDDDILDALVALWTAERIADGRAVMLPDVPPRDRFGLPMEMVA